MLALESPTVKHGYISLYFYVIKKSQGNINPVVQLHWPLCVAWNIFWTFNLFFNFVSVFWRSAGSLH